MIDHVVMALMGPFRPWTHTIVDHVEMGPFRPWRKTMFDHGVICLTMV